MTSNLLALEVGTSVQSEEDPEIVIGRGKTPTMGVLPQLQGAFYPITYNIIKLSNTVSYLPRNAKVNIVMKS